MIWLEHSNTEIKTDHPGANPSWHVAGNKCLVVSLTTFPKGKQLSLRTTTPVSNLTLGRVQRGLWPTMIILLSGGGQFSGESEFVRDTIFLVWRWQNYDFGLSSFGCCRALAVSCLCFVCQSLRLKSADTLQGVVRSLKALTIPKFVLHHGLSDWLW